MNNGEPAGKPLRFHRMWTDLACCARAAQTHSSESIETQHVLINDERNIYAVGLIEYHYFWQSWHPTDCSITLRGSDGNLLDLSINRHAFRKKGPSRQFLCNDFRVREVVHIPKVNPLLRSWCPGGGYLGTHGGGR